jgi:hypothetical protein
MQTSVRRRKWQFLRASIESKTFDKFLPILWCYTFKSLKNNPFLRLLLNNNPALTDK